MGSIIIGVFVYARNFNYLTIRPVIAGDVNEPIEESILKEKKFLSLNNFIKNNKIMSIDKSADIYYLVGNSLSLFGLNDNQKVIVRPINNPEKEIKKGDILILKTQAGPNQGKLKGRVCLGFWNNQNEEDNDLVKYESYDNSVLKYFKEESPKKYGYTEPYDGPITGYLKTLSCDQGIRKKISRPHDPKLIVGKVEYVIH